MSTAQEHRNLQEIDGEAAYLRGIFRDDGGREAKRMIAIINLAQMFLRDVRRIANAIEAEAERREET